jgi:hypothetical protein
MYYYILKYVSDNYFPDDYKFIIRTLLFIFPLIIKNLFNYITKKSFVKMTLQTKKLYSLLLSKEKYDELKSFISKNYNDDIRIVELAYYSTGSNILIYAVQENNIELVEYLLDKGFNVNCRDLKN